MTTITNVKFECGCIVDIELGKYNKYTGRVVHPCKYHTSPVKGALSKLLTPFNKYKYVEGI